MAAQYPRTTIASNSQTSPFTDQPQANNPAFQAGQQRRIQGNPNLGQAIQGGIPAGGTTPFAGAQQLLGSSPQGIDQSQGQQTTMPMHRFFGGQQSNPGTFPTQQPTGTSTGSATPQPSASSDPYAANGGYSFAIPQGFDPSNPTDKFVLDHFQKYISRAQAGDPGAQPTADNMNYWRTQINNGGGPSDYWDHRMTPGDPSNDPGANSGGGGGGFSSNILQNAILGQQMGTSAASNNQGNPSAIWQQILAQLQGASQLK